MKKLLVILMLGAGFVTTASAQSLDCTDNTTNQCCIDVVSIYNAINASATQSITTKDNYQLTGIGRVLLNDGINGTACVDKGLYNASGGKQQVASFEWIAGSWINSIQNVNNNSSNANKDNVIPLTPINPITTPLNP